MHVLGAWLTSAMPNLSGQFSIKPQCNPPLSSVFFSRGIFWATRDIFRKSARDTEKVPVTILDKVPVTIVVLRVQNTTALMATRDIFSKKCPRHARDNSQKSTRDTQKVPVTNLKKKLSRPLSNVTGKRNHCSLYYRKFVTIWRSVMFQVFTIYLPIVF